MWPFDIARKRKEREEKELQEAVDRGVRWMKAKEAATAGRIRAQELHKKVTGSASQDSYSDPFSPLNPLSPLSPVYMLSTYDSDPSPSRCSDSSSSSSSDYSSSYDSSSSSSSDSGSSSSSCD